MKICPSCGFENNNKSKFCSKCGSVLSTPEESGQSDSAVREMPNVREMPKQKSKAWIIAVIAVAVIAAAVAAFLIFRPGSDGALPGEGTGTESEAGTEQTAKPSEDNTGNVYDAYAEILKENESDIRAYTAQSGAPDKAVVISDISGDGVPELLFFSGEVSSQLWVYTYLDGSAVECTYDYSLLPEYNRGAGNDGLFTDAYVAGGTTYMIYTGKKPGEFYIAYTTSSGGMHCNSIRYKFGDDATITADKMLANEFGPNTQGPGEYDWYYLNGSEVDMDKGVKELKADREAFDRLLMNKGFNEEMKVYELTKNHKPESMTFDEALDKCVNG